LSILSNITSLERVSIARFFSSRFAHGFRVASDADYAKIGKTPRVAWTKPRSSSERIAYERVRSRADAVTRSSSSLHRRIARERVVNRA